MVVVYIYMSLFYYYLFHRDSIILVCVRNHFGAKLFSARLGVVSTVTVETGVIAVPVCFPASGPPGEDVSPDTGFCAQAAIKHAASAKL